MLTHFAVGRTTIWLGQTAAEGELTVGLSELLVQSVDERPGVDVDEVLQTSALGAAGWVVIRGTAPLETRGGACIGTSIRGSRDSGGGSQRHVRMVSNR